MLDHTATYSPEDNKLRLYPAHRLDAETYRRVKEAGFIWAGKQELFVAPSWTPYREDLLIELCGEIGDEDTSLVERAEDRADRFESYSDHRAKDAEAARKSVAAIADNIPLGQPILVGHHSEKHARRDAKKIDDGMRKAVKMWETSKYWADRATGALRHAKYKERPDVRHRRIKGLESDIRVYRARFTPDTRSQPQIWDGIEHVYCAPPTGGRGGSWVKTSSLPALEKIYSRWIQHCENRLVYERAMLGEAGGLISDRFNVEIGGRVLVGGQWLVVLRVNRSNGSINSVTTNSPTHVNWCKTWKYGIEEVHDYRAPEAGDAAKVKKATKLPPLCNYPGEGFLHITKADWEKKCADYKQTRTMEATEQQGRHRVRYGFFGVSAGLTSKSGYEYVYLTDVKRVDAPNQPEAAPELATFTPEHDHAALGERLKHRQQQLLDKEPNEFEAMKEALCAGVQVVSAPQLFPTPLPLVARMLDIADIQANHRVLEPSAGTGAILKAIGNGPETVAIEINQQLVSLLAQSALSGVRVHQADFLECNSELGEFDRVLMNPPFENGADIKHIQHALTMLKPGGKLIAICANGPRQNAILKPLVDAHGGDWEVLPADTFKGSGTKVSTVLLSLTATT